eukprot:Lithocolla_globosa_v1_NODE_7393_length_952_cov_966.381271.p2 type:complete len:163 gc:universal NODE_7393_length_952_cov_966.381271:871-383(-)
MFNSRFGDPEFEPPPGTYITFRLRDKVEAISFCASMRRSSMRPFPCFRKASEILAAASDSPSERMMPACFSCSAFSTKKAARAASCSATCFCSTASVNSLPKVKSTIEISSNKMLKTSPRRVRLARIFSETCSRMVINSAASCSATIALRISFPIEGKTRSS